MAGVNQRVFGELPGIMPGASFASRKEVSEVGLHGPWQSGIHGTAKEGASSIVVSGGYVDDRDLGGTIIYTGHGGRDAGSGRQVRDQSLDDPGNAGLVTSCLENLPVRVIKGASGGPYVYEGLFQVTDYWSKPGADGYRVWQFKLEAIEGGYSFTRDDPVQAGKFPVPEGDSAPIRKQAVTQRLVRSTRVVEFVKDLYDDACQMCMTVLSHPGGRTSEGAHVRALGAPHNGQDVVSNVICLCPNHHTLFDRGGVWVDQQQEIHSFEAGSLGQLYVDSRHELDMENFSYHRSLWDY
jgi:putative restriction endonuclease